MIAWIVAMFFAWYGPDQIFNFFLQFLAWLVGPIAMTVIADYWFFPKSRKKYDSEEGINDMKYNPAAYLAWIVGFLAGYFTQGFYVSLFNGMIVTAIIYYTWTRIAHDKGTTPEAQFKSWFGKG